MMTDETKKPPEGVLATNALAAEPAVVVPEVPKPVTETPSPAVARVLDRGYMEPTPLAKFRTTHDGITREEPHTTEELGKQNLQRKVLIDFLLERVGVLEQALKPFCITGTMFSNAHMSLSALNRDGEPAGGTWISNPPDGIQLQPTQGYFFAAIDALGRAATEAHMAAIFEQVQQANKLVAEKAAHVEAGGTVH